MKRAGFAVTKATSFGCERTDDAPVVGAALSHEHRAREDAARSCVVLLASFPKELESRRSVRRATDAEQVLAAENAAGEELVCGVGVENVADPRMQKIRYLDKLVDELAKGKQMASMLRQ